MLWFTLCHMVSEELCSQSVMERQTDGRRTKIYEKYGYQQIKIQDAYMRCKYMTNVLAFSGLWPILAVYPQVSCDYFCQYDLWWSQYWSCDRYLLRTLAPSNKQTGPFLPLNLKKSKICHVQIVIRV